MWFQTWLYRDAPLGAVSPSTFQHQSLPPRALRLQAVVRTQPIAVRDSVVRPAAVTVLQEEPLAEVEELVADGVVPRRVPGLVLRGGKVWTRLKAGLSSGCDENKRIMQQLCVVVEGSTQKKRYGKSRG